MGNMQLWMRVGVTLDITEEQAKKLLLGDSDTLKSVLMPDGVWDSVKGKLPWKFDGESYIADDDIDELCERFGLNRNDEEVGSDLIL